MRPGVVLAVMYTVVELAYVVLMIAAAVSKIVEFGWLEYVQHFTNWSYTMQIIFYVVMLPVPLLIAVDVDDSKLEMLGRFAAITFVPLWGIVTTVLVLVIFMLITGSQLLDSFVGTTPISMIVLDNEVFHFFTVFRLLVWASINQRFVYFMLNDLFSRSVVHKNKRIFLGLLAYEMVIGSTIPLLLYNAIFDYQVVYQTSTKLVLAIVAVLLSLVLASSPMLLFIYGFYMGYSPLTPKWMAESEFDDVRDRIINTMTRLKG